MPSALPTTLEELVKIAILADGPLADFFLAQGRVLEEALFPRAQASGVAKDVLGPNTPTPFLIVETGGVSGQIALYSDVTIRVYDDPRQRYWRIEDITNLLSRALDHKQLEPAQDGYDNWQRLDRAYVSPKLTDPDWQKNWKYIRFNVYGL